VRTEGASAGLGAGVMVRTYCTGVPVPYVPVHRKKKKVRWYEGED